MQSKNEFEIAIAGSTTEIKILSPASMPDSPIKPNKGIIYGMGGATFIILSFVFIVISYLAHDKIDSIDDVERNTTATLLGSVPKYKSSKKQTQIIVNEHPKSALSESMRSIRTNLEFMLPSRDAKVYSFTSTIGSEGKTFISTNLGLLLAMAGKKVIILDLDLRRPKVHKAFDHISDGIITLNKNGHVTYMNPSAEQLTGWNSADAEGLQLKDVFHVVDEKSHESVVESLIDRSYKGQNINISSTCLLVRRDGGHPARLPRVCCGLNVTTFNLIIV